jgi:acyl-CoA synthetase (AMP-forming)/AMP-acid ligase II/acyl carrier protein
MHPLLLERLQTWAQTRPGQAALIHLTEAEHEEQRLDHRTLQACIGRVAARLQQAGIEPGERVLLSARCEVRYLVGLLGCLRAGVIAVPTLTPANERALARMQAHGEDAGAVALLGDAWVLARRPRLTSPHSAWIQGLQWIDLEPAFLPGSASPEEPTEPAHASATVAYLQYTSGSTSRPKGVRVTHGNLAAQLGALEQALEHAPGDVVCNWMPLYHDFGLIMSLQALYCGGTAVLLPSVPAVQRPARWLQALSRYRAVTSAAPNFMFHRCVERVSEQERQGLDLSALRTLMNGAEPIHPDCVRDFTEAFRGSGFQPECWRNSYGLAEATLSVTMGAKGQGCRITRFDAQALRNMHAEPEPAGQELASCGPPLIEGSLVVVSPHTHERCPPGQVGEVWLAGPSVADGYWGGVEGGFGAHVADEPGGTSYLRTGDLATLWQGELYIAGRLKDLVIVRGENHYPQDIEATVCHAHPAIEPNGAAAFAVEGAEGEALAVVAEVRREAFRRLDAQEVFAAMRRAVAEAHGLDPAHLVLLRPGTLPRTSSGKVQRNGCRKEWQESTLPVVEEWVAIPPAPPAPPTAAPAPAAPSDLEAALLALCRTLLESPTLKADTNLFEAGADSLKAADLTLAIEDRFGHNLDLADLAEHPSARALALLIRSRQAPLPTPDAPRNWLARLLRRDIGQGPTTAPPPPASEPPTRATAATFFLGDAPEYPELSREVLTARLRPYLRAWRGERASPNGLVLGRNAKGSRPPLFWVFQGHQEWAALAQALGPEQPLYGMRSGHLVMPYTDANVQTLATAYRREMQALHPGGPYFIGGNCQGGLIAMAVAQQMLRLQQEVPLLVLMEWAFTPQPYPGELALIWGQRSEMNSFASIEEAASCWRPLCFELSVDWVDCNHGSFFATKNVGRLAEFLLNRLP